MAEPTSESRDEKSLEQVENGITSISLSNWDTDDDENCGPKPADLFGEYLWTIDNYSQIKDKRELRSNVFEVGSHKWYILIYPQGCDVSNYLSLFLCVDKRELLPGWSHFAQFTLALVNKDHKKSKYSDTLHRFWRLEHDWGWKKFVELPRVLDGFVDADRLVIKAQVQVIREIPDRLFRCLDSRYRRELMRVYLKSVEHLCYRYVEEKRNELVKHMDDKARWSSFRAFWISVDENARRHMCREKTDVILRDIVKKCFIEKDVTSTLVMDSLYSGLRALEGRSKGKVGSQKLLNAEDLPAPIFHAEKDMLVLVDDVLKLLERVSMELPREEDKGLQYRTKDGCLEDWSKEYIRDKRRLTELGCRIIQIYVLAHIFSKIEIAHQEAISLKMQEELIREVETEQRVKRGVSEKVKKLKKRQV